MRKFLSAVLILIIFISFASAQRKQERGYNVYLWGATGNGTTDDRNAISRLDAWADFEGLPLYFPTGTYLIESDITIASDCEFETGAQLSIDAAATVTFTGLINANEERIFTGSGAVVLASQPIIQAAWWGGGDFVGIYETSPTAALDVNGDAILTGTSRYLNFNTTSGTSGYGFRDNAGNIQVKHSGGAWTNLAASSGISIAGETQGDVIWYDAGAWTRLAVGAAGQVLEVNAAGTGVEWDTDDAAAGGGNDTYIEEGDAAKVDSTGADLYFDFDGTDFDVGVAGNEANITVNSGGIDHDATTNFVADEHVAHTGVTLTAGAGLSGGGDISANRTFTFDPTEVNSITWGDGTQATIPMIFDMSAGDQTITAESGKITFGGTIKISGGSPGSGKVLISDADGDGTWGAAPAGGVPTYSVGTFTDTDATPDISGNTSFNVSNTGATTITALDGGTAGDVRVLKFTNGNTIIADDDTNIELMGDINFTGSADDTLMLWYDGSKWFETNRSVN